VERGVVVGFGDAQEKAKKNVVKKMGMRGFDLK